MYEIISNSEQLYPLAMVSVGSYKVPDEVLAKMESIVTQIGNNPRKLKQRDHSKMLAGKIVSGMQIDLMPDLDKATKQFIENVAVKYALSSSVELKGLKKYKLKECWAVLQLAGDYNPPHLHSGDLSGVFYVKVPKQIQNSGLSQGTAPEINDGFIQFVMGSALPHGPWINQSKSFRPEVGNLFIFPSWLMHAVAPFKGKGERLSIAFNLVEVASSKRAN